MPEQNQNGQSTQSAISVHRSSPAGEALHQRPDLLARIIETSPAGLGVTNSEGQFIFANARAEQLLGLTRDQITQRTYKPADWAVTDWDGISLRKEDTVFQQARATGRPIYNAQRSVHKPNGERIFLLVNGVPLLDEQDQLVGVIYGIEDITEQKKAETVLQRILKEEQAQLHLTQTLQKVGALLTTQMSLDEVLEKLFDLLAQVIDYDSVSIHLLDQDKWTNLRAWRGFPDVKAARQLIKSFGWEKLRERWQSQRAHVIPDTRTKEYWIVTPGLEYIRSWVGAALIVKGRLIGELSVDSATLNAYDESAAQTVLAFANQAAIAIENARLYEEAQQEITERSKVEKALRESEERYRRVSDLASDFAYSFRIERDGRAVLEWMTEAYSRITGYAVDEMHTLELWISLIHPDDWSTYDEQMQALLAGRSDTSEFRIVAKTGEVRWLRNSGRPVWDETQQRVVRVFGAVQDITERVRADEVLRQRTAQLVARNEELDAFAYTVAHDLKNPLTVTITSAETLLENLNQRSETELKEVLSSIARNGRKMSAIIDSLLLLAGAREMAVEPQLLDMAEIVKEVLDRFAAMIEENRAEIVTPNSWPVAVGHGPWIEQVWTNYLTNALKYGGHPPRLEFGAAPSAGDKARFWIQDNGPGLTPEQQLQVFTPFVRFDQSSDAGHGLGLPIVKRIVEKLGGQVWVESKPGQGSVFGFTLPAPRQPE